MMSFLWQGDDLPGYSANKYDLEYVARLARGVWRWCGEDAELVIIADDHYAPLLRAYVAERAPYHTDWRTRFRVDIMAGFGIGGWSNVLEGFRPGLQPKEGERVVMVGLDTVFVGDSSWLFDWNEAPIGLPLDPYHDPEPCDAVIVVSPDGAWTVWNYFIAEAKRNKMKDHLMAGVPSEMMLLRHLSKVHGWAKLEPRATRLLSWKVHLNKNLFTPKTISPRWPSGTSLVYFHGRPKPADLPEEDPIRKEWEREWIDK